MGSSKMPKSMIMFGMTLLNDNVPKSKHVPGMSVSQTFCKG